MFRAAQKCLVLCYMGDDMKYKVTALAEKIKAGIPVLAQNIKNTAVRMRRRIENLAGFLLSRGNGRVLFLTDQKALANVLTVAAVLLALLLIRFLIRFLIGAVVLLVAGGVLMQVFYGGRSDNNR